MRAPLLGIFVVPVEYVSSLNKIPSELITTIKNVINTDEMLKRCGIIYSLYGSNIYYKGTPYRLDANSRPRHTSASINDNEDMRYIHELWCKLLPIINHTLKAYAWAKFYGCEQTFYNTMSLSDEASPEHKAFMEDYQNQVNIFKGKVILGVL